MTTPKGKVTCDLTISADGYAAGLNQSEERPFGDDGGDGWGDKLHAWYSEGAEKHPAEFARMMTAKAFIMGRNMFGPVRGEWDRQWNGWWGDNPPYHGSVFVLTHHPRDPQPMEGGTTFHFVTDGILAALERARAAAGDKDVRISGGPETVREYLDAGLVDEVTLHVSPMLMGDGLRMLDKLKPGLVLEPRAVIPSAQVTHITYEVVK